MYLQRGNTEGSKERRHQYARWLTSPEVKNITKLNVEEFVMNIHTKRKQGHSVERSQSTFKKEVNQQPAEM